MAVSDGMRHKQNTMHPGKRIFISYWSFGRLFVFPVNRSRFWSRSNEGSGQVLLYCTIESSVLLAGSDCPESTAMSRVVPALFA